VSELDITIPNNTEAQLAKQAEEYGAILRLLLPYSGQLEAVQVWGVSDNLSWRASGYPLLFDGSQQPKPAFWAVVDALEDKAP
jgi:endo-1,4-beta-xylanase